LGAPQVVLACSSCYQVFKANLPDVKIVSLWELYDRLGIPDRALAAGGETKSAVSVHDPCATRYAGHIQDSARNILRRLGYQIEELPLSREKTECCSYGGLMWLANRELAQAVVRRRISASQADYVTYCAVCRDFFAAQGKRTLHLLDLIYGQDLNHLAERKSPGYSQRHENRARLKRKLLKELWGEDMDGQAAYAAIRLIIADDVQERLEQRLILVEDIQQVIELAERTGSKLLNRQTGHWLAHHRPNAVTYWVEYTLHGDAFVVHNAYSHRMQVAEDVKV
ncbi:MAG: (Fe-S)-binding protein, partial [Bacteroidales bacterium]